MKNILLSLFFLLQISTNMTAQTFKYDLQATTVVAQSGYYQLTQGDLNASIEYMEFILAEAITPEDQQVAQANLIQQFQANPMGIATEIQQVRQVLPYIASLTDITQIAAYRNSVITTLHLQFMNNPNRPILLQLLDKYNPILIYDMLSNICLTNRDIEGLLAFTELSYNIVGQTPPSSNPAGKQQLIQQLENQIYSMNPTDKQGLVVLADYVPFLRQAFLQLSPEQKAQIKQEYLKTMIANQNTNQSTQQCQGCSERMKALYAKQANGTLTQYDLAEMQRELNAQQNMYTMMNNMSLESHATMLNVINNIGGGSDVTYEVKYNNY
ncbi:MAG: hypothetical protein AAGJ18_19775 [Bacteroidota bacterium]